MNIINSYQRLKYVATINDDTLPEDTDPDYELNYIDIGNVNSQGEIITIAEYKFSDAPSRARRIVQKGDVIVSTVRTYLKAITSIENDYENLIVSTGFAVIRPDKKLLNQTYCKYAILDERFIEEIQKRSVGVSYPAINASDIGDIKLSIPSLTQQNKIVDFLDKEVKNIDALIDKKMRLVSLLEEKKKATISRAVTKGLNPNVKMKSSGLDWLGDIPEHWKLVRLKYLSDGLKYGANEAAEEDNPDFPRYIRITDIDENGNLKPETFKSISLEIANEYLLEDGDILFARSGATVGKTFRYISNYGKSAYAGYLIRMRPNRKIDSQFMYYFTLSNSYWSQIYIDSIQATIQNFSGDKYANMLITIPSNDEQIQIAKYLDYYLKQFSLLRDKVTDSIDLLKEKRTAIISSAINAEINLD